MKKRLLILPFFLLLGGIFLIAQDTTDDPVIVVNASEGAKVLSLEKGLGISAIPIGESIPRRSIIMLPKGGFATLSAGGKTHFLEKKRKQKVWKVVGEPSSILVPGLESTFSTSMSLASTGTTKGSDPKGSGSAWGGLGQDITICQPLFGRLCGEETLLQWSKPSGNGAYLVEIVDQAGGSFSKNLESVDTSLLVNLKDLTPGTAYSWRVKRKNDSSIKSEWSSFTWESTETLDSELAEATSGLNIGKFDDITRTLIEATFLEEKGWTSAALNRYLSLGAQYPTHPMVTKAAQSFFVRQGISFFNK
ncbi:MAG: fibronectin type III domain-containing protein [Lewinellaceae bacterium]|nr:fibronectin type III domain-containing protein [Lewinellaceae bacterium]